MKAIGVTGGSGFIGTWVAKQLRAGGYEVVVMDRWGKHTETEGPSWLKEHFGVERTGQLTKLQAEKALQLLLAQ